MGKANELIVVEAILTKSACGDTHTAIDVAVESGLRTVILLKVGDELLGSRGQTECLGLTLIALPRLKNLLLGGLVFKLNENSRGVTVGHRNAKALGCDNGCRGRNNLTILHTTPYAKGLLLALLLLATDEGNKVIHHLGPLVKGLARTADSLIGGSNNLLDAVLHKGSKKGHVGLNRAIGLYSDKATLGAKTCSLCLDNLKVRIVDLGNNHGDVGSPSVGRVVGNNGNLRLGISLLKRLGLILGHRHSTEHKVTKRLYSLDIIGGNNLHIKNTLGAGVCHLPSAKHSLAILLTCRAGACHNGRNLKIGMLVKEHDKSLAYHTGSTDYTNLKLFHIKT